MCVTMLRPYELGIVSVTKRETRDVGGIFVSFRGKEEKFREGRQKGREFSGPRFESIAEGQAIRAKYQEKDNFRAEQEPAYLVERISSSPRSHFCSDDIQIRHLLPDSGRESLIACNF